MTRPLDDVEDLELVDAGGGTELWRGLLDGLPVAVKRGRQGSLLAEEARLQRFVTHPAVLPVVALLDDPTGGPGGAALVVPWVAGGSLASQLDADVSTGAWTADHVAEVLDVAAHVLHAVHAAGLVHGDLSADNLLLDLDGHVWLADFGRARVASGATDPGFAADRAALAALVADLAGSRRAGGGAVATLPVREVRGPRPRRPRTLEFGPRPPRAVVGAAVPRTGPGRRGTVLGVAVALAALALGVPALTARLRPPVSRCASAAPPTRPHLSADLLGRGCPQRVELRDGVLSVDVPGEHRARRYLLGRPGDRLLVGRWRCAAVASPALYRPSTGEVLTYPSLPRAPGPAAAVVPDRLATGVRNGTAVVDHHPSGCDRVVVQPGRRGGARR